MGKVKALLMLGVIAGMTIYLWNYVPIKFNNAEFQDSLDDIVRRNSYGQKTDDDIKEQVVAKAKTLDIVIKADAVTVSRSSDGLGIVVHYHAHFDFPVIPYDNDFVVASVNRRI